MKASLGSLQLIQSDWEDNECLNVLQESIHKLSEAPGLREAGWLLRKPSLRLFHLNRTPVAAWKDSG